MRLTDDELTRAIDREAPLTSPGLGFYFGELERRRNARSSARMEELTFDINGLTADVRRLTWAVTWLTVLSVAIAVAALIVAITRH